MRVRLVLALLMAAGTACPAQVLSVTSDFVRHRLPPLDWSQPQAERAFSLPYQMSEDPSQGYSLQPRPERDLIPPIRMSMRPRVTYGSGDTTCYFIRSYYARKDAPNSDATRIVGQSVCTMSSRFRQKQAIQPVERPAVLPATW